MSHNYRDSVDMSSEGGKRYQEAMRGGDVEIQDPTLARIVQQAAAEKAAGAGWAKAA